MNRWALNFAIIIAAFAVPAALADILDETDIPIGHYHASPLTAVLTNNVALNNIGTYFDGPSVAQGNVGTWFASGCAEVADTNGLANFLVKLWDGINVIASAQFNQANTSSICLSGYITGPAGNIKLSVRDGSSTGGAIAFNQSGNAKDSILTVYRIR